MKKPAFSLGALGALSAIVAWSFTVSADAPIGADSQYLPFSNSNKQISDRFTHLVWQRPSDPYPAPVNYALAQASCTGTTRLPTLKELLTLVDEQPHREYEGSATVEKTIDQRAFDKTPTDQPFWTSTPYQNKNNTFWTVNFNDGTPTNYPDTGSAYVRCVAYVK